MRSHILARTEVASGFVFVAAMLAAVTAFILNGPIATSVLVGAAIGLIISIPFVRLIKEES